MSDLISPDYLDQAIDAITDKQVERVTNFTKRVVPEDEVSEILAMLGLNDDVEVVHATNDYGLRKRRV